MYGMTFQKICPSSFVHVLHYLQFSSPPIDAYLDLYLVGVWNVYLKLKCHAKTLLPLSDCQFSTWLWKNIHSAAWSKLIMYGIQFIYDLDDLGFVNCVRSMANLWLKASNMVPLETVICMTLSCMTTYLCCKRQPPLFSVTECNELISGWVLAWKVVNKLASPSDFFYSISSV